VDVHRRASGRPDTGASHQRFGVADERAHGRVYLAGLLAIDSPASSTLTREFWLAPIHPCLIDDLDEGHYFDRAVASSGRA
jgi:hypothetical protein